MPSIYPSVSFVYFISDNQGNVKIGKANDIQKRLKELQTGNANELKLVASIICNGKDACEVETGFHKDFDFCKVNGEWFSEKHIFRFLEQRDHRYVRAINGIFRIKKLHFDECGNQVFSAKYERW